MQAAIHLSKKYLTSHKNEVLSSALKRIEKFLLLFIVANLLVVTALAQQKEVRVRVVDPLNQPIPFATVKAVQLPDSLQKVQKITDSSGSAFLLLSAGNLYQFEISSVGYIAIKETRKVNTETDQLVFTAEKKGNTLNSVVVTATKPLMRQEDDKTIVDPENLANSSTNGFEILEKTPGLFVDQDGNIYLNSTSPAQIYINGRQQRMSTADIATMLKSLPPNAISSIEIVRTPSARYDASGGGGIVNVVLKKGVKLGLSGSANIGLLQGRYGNQTAGANLNNNNGRLSTFINIQWGKRNTYEQIKTDRFFAPDSVLRQDAYTRYPTNSYYIGFGANYSLSAKWDVNYDGRISYNNHNNSTVNESMIEKISTSGLVSRNLANVQNKGGTLGVTQGFSTKFKVDSLGSEWTTDFSYNYIPNNGSQFFTTDFLQPTFPGIGGDGEIDSRLHSISAQTNFLWRLPKKLSIETGLKTTGVSFYNAANYFREYNGNRSPDRFRTATYRYTENIHAAYLQASKTISGIILKAGTRVENTNMDGRQTIPMDTSFTIHRTDFFPYIYLSKKIMSVAGYDLRAYLVYRRTISRPGYEQLNPYPRYVDQYLYETGNPTLRPQFTKNYEANISVDERPLIAIGVNETKDIFTNVIYQADTGRSTAYRTFDNLGNNKETYFRMLGAIPPGKRYFFVVGAQYNHNFYRGIYEKRDLTFKRGSWTLFTYHLLKITPLTQLSVNGFVRFNGQMQFYELSSFGSLNMSLSQQFFNKKLMVSVNATDLLFTNNNRFFISQGTVNASGFRRGDTRRFGLTMRYNFGFRKKEDQNMFQMESPEKAQ